MPKFKVLSRDNLKLIALISMIFDHIGFMFISFNSPLYFIFRMLIGRFSYVLFLFLFVTGFYNIKPENYKKHLKDLLFFAFVSQLGYMFMYDGIWHISFFRLNIMFSWLFCFVMLILLSFIKSQEQMYTKDGVLFLSIMTILIFGIIGFAIRLDYYGISPLVIGFAYLYINYCNENCLEISYSRLALYIAVVIAILSNNPFELLGSIPVLFYNPNNKAHNFKYLYYWMYPVHLMILCTVYMIIY